MSERNATPDPPVIEIFDCFESGDSAQVRAWLEQHSDRVLTRCLDSPGARVEALLAGLEVIEVSLVSDAAIAEVHGRFMDDPTPTDVITFQHGEILIGLETAGRSAAEHGHDTRREALLYLIHGLLHLNGFDDVTEEARAEMETGQFEILDAVSPLSEGKNQG